jgi:antitoxin (DNA-binding transcriptional repressor) of toxin-antitoxin stability system
VTDVAIAKAGEPVARLVPSAAADWLHTWTPHSRALWDASRYANGMDTPGLMPEHVSGAA